jgi:anthranilate phosphoribosyltransferase
MRPQRRQPPEKNKEETMSYGHYIKEIGRGAQGARDLSQEDARQLYAAMLDGGVPDLELGALILGLRVKGESLDEMLGFLAATDERTHQFEMPHGRGRPVVLPTYNGARKEANLTPLLALLLQRFGVPVLVHGLIEGYGRVTSAHIFRELGILPVASVRRRRPGWTRRGWPSCPSARCAPVFTTCSLRARMGVRNSAHSLVKLLDPFRGEAVLVAPATHPDFIDLMRNIMQARGQRGLLLRGTEGEPYANPSAGRGWSTSMTAFPTSCSKPSTKACAPCPICRKPRCGQHGTLDPPRARQADSAAQAHCQSTGLPAFRQRLCRRFQSGQGHRRR